MTFFDKLRLKDFWIAFAKVAIPFFIAVVVVFLIMSNSRELFSGSWKVIYQQHFADGKWQHFFAPKILGTIIYSFWVTNKNFK